MVAPYVGLAKDVVIKLMMVMMPLDDEQNSTQRQSEYFYKKKTETRKKISGNVCWGFAGERGLWKCICKYKRKMQKTFFGK